MSQPTPYDPSTDFSVEFPGDQGNALDREFDDIQLSIDETLANLALLQRDDGSLVNGLVTPFSLSAETVAALSDWTIRGAWLTATNYAQFDFVTQSGISYLCLVAHTSGTFSTDLAAGKWTAISKVDSATSAFSLTLLDDISASAWLTTLGFSANGQSLVAAADYAAMRALLDVPTNGDVTTALSDHVAKSLVDAKGDLLVGSANDAVVKKAVGNNGEILVADSGQSDGLIWSPRPQKSLLRNANFMIDQRVNSSTSRADDTYCLDGWYVLTQSNPIAVSQQSAQEDGQHYNVRLSQSNASAQRMGIAQILEGRDCKHLRGKTVTFRPRVRCSSNQAIRIAVLEWTGTEDSVTSDVVNSWTSGAYTAGNFFLASNLTVSGVGAKTPAAATWTDMDGLTVTLGSTFNNLIVMVWTEGTAAQNVTLDVGQALLVRGSYAGEIEFTKFQEVLAHCYRYYQKSFPLATAPAQNVASYEDAACWSVAVAGATSNRSPRFYFGVPMRAAPAMTSFNPSAANAQVRVDGVGDTTGTSFSSSHSPSAKGFHVACTGHASGTVGQQFIVHWTADAEL